MITRDRRKALAAYARWKSGHIHCMTSAAGIEEMIRENNGDRKPPFTDHEINYVTEAIQREHRLHVRHMRACRVFP